MATAAKFRIDVAIHDLLMNSAQRPPAPAEAKGLTLPQPIFPQFPERLNDPSTCQHHCFSTLNHNLAYCYNDARVIRWLWSNAKNRFQGGLGFLLFFFRSPASRPRGRNSGPM